MKKSILSIIALALSTFAMAQKSNLPGDYLQIEIKQAGISLPVESTASLVVVNDSTIPFFTIARGECDPNLLSNFSQIKIDNPNYSSTLNVIKYNTEEDFNGITDFFIQYILENTDFTDPSVSHINAYMVPDAEDPSRLNYSVLNFSGLYSPSGSDNGNLYSCYSIIYLRSIKGIAVIQVFADPANKQGVDDYHDACIYLNKDYCTTPLLSEKELKGADDGVDFLQKLLMKIKDATLYESLKMECDFNIANQYYVYKQLFGHNAPSYNGQDSSLSDEQKKNIEEWAKNVKKK